jgi:HK97 family phage major capsid protein
MAGVFDSMITRGDAAPLIPEQEAVAIIQTIPETSVAASLLRTVRMSTKTLVQPVLGSLPVAYWVNGDTGLKQTTDVLWQGITLTAEELAVIVPIPEAVIADAGYPIWSEVRPLLAEAIGLKLDQAVFSGTDKPATWPNAIIPGAIAAGNTNVADSPPEQGGMTNDLIETFDDVEDDGYDVTGIAAMKRIRGALRKSRDTTGQRLLDVSTNSVEGVTISYVQPGVFVSPNLAVVGDFSMAILGVRQDLSWKMLDQAVITDDTGKVLLNLPQQDSVALRVTARYGYALAAPITRREADITGTAFPFGVMQSAPVGP